MRQRCAPSQIAKKVGKHWAAKGISICARWLDSYENFLADMGECPDGMTLERKDVKGHYEPGNCVWATWTTQANNRSNNRHIELNGQTKTMAEWARNFNVPIGRVKTRLANGWTPEQAFKLPLRHRVKRRLKSSS
jgi:hypothetical protein